MTTQVEKVGGDIMILFGDGGGWMIDAHGEVHHIDPYGPAVTEMGAAIGQLSQAAEILPAGEHGDGLERTIDRTAEQFVDGLHVPPSVHAIVVVGDGAPWCGTRPGRWHPHPLPQPSGHHPTS